MRIIARSVIVLKPLKCARLTNLQWYISTLVRRGFELAFNWYFQKLIFLDLLSLGIDWNHFERLKHFPKKNQEISTFRFFHPFVWLLLLLFLCWTIILYHVGKLWFRASLFSSSSCLFCRLKCVDYRVRLTLFRLALLPQQSDYEKKREKKKVVQMSRTNRHASYSFLRITNIASISQQLAYCRIDFSTWQIHWELDSKEFFFDRLDKDQQRSKSVWPSMTIRCLDWN